MKGEASDWLTLTSDVLQGSLLGPLFFIVYINDLPGVISKDSSIALYADDSKMYRVISTQEDLSTFQSDKDKISDWCKMNKMRINTKKCKIMRITRKKAPLIGEYNIEGQPSESVNVYKDLGLLRSTLGERFVIFGDPVVDGIPVHARREDSRFLVTWTGDVQNLRHFE